MGGENFRTPQTGPGAHPASYTMDTGSFPRVKRPGRGADHPPPSQRRGHERVGLYLYSPSGPQWPVMGEPLPYLLLARPVLPSNRKGTALLISSQVCPSDTSIKTEMSIEHWLNDADREEQRNTPVSVPLRAPKIQHGLRVDRPAATNS